ncbi:50S ribosomal protein L25/general stress protein Ctc [Phocaeicola oris]|uniref:50S ribosomal protein L25/general stress protein Ctc n=1 Tax=Phocaeicola oris TaxID=2896850 RepID=UPI00234F6675|nr:50S ribosomal protein L25/general stress protein Ctc [Phocaeicola oris]MCE2615641.1 50S ribosomal protein L25/general stress protein Ctc [Phocaeicola oris]
MKSIDIKGIFRKDLGKKATKALRKENIVPCVIYGAAKNDKGETSVTHFQVPAGNLRKLIYTPEIFVVNLEIDGVVKNAILQEVQFHPLHEQILHIDFLEIDEAKPIVMNVPVVLQGLAPGVLSGGKLHHQMRKLKVRALYTAIPEFLTVDISKLKLGKSIKVGDLKFDNLELLNPKDAVVCSVKTTRSAVEDSNAATETDATEAEPANAE